MRNIDPMAEIGTQHTAAYDPDAAKPLSQFDDTTFRAELVALIPHLRAFSRSLCGDATLADDVVQDTLVKAWVARERFTPGTNMKAWTFTILRNQFYSLKRRSWRAQSLDPEIAEQTIMSVETPLAAIELNELRRAMNDLPENQREAIILVGAAGFTYNEAAEICDVATGTIKSRVCRARATLAEVFLTGNCGGSRDGVSAMDAMKSLTTEIDEIVAGASARDSKDAHMNPKRHSG